MKLLSIILIFFFYSSCYCQKIFLHSSVEDAVANASFHLKSKARTSAGVFKSDGTLVRTLWSGVTKEAGTYAIKWDGTDDNFNALPVDNYTVKILTNNVRYDWQGVIGNTSLKQTGKGIHRSLNPTIGIVINGTKATYIAGYGEGTAAHFQFNLGNPQLKLDPFSYATNQITNYVCTDGVNVYYTCTSNYHNNSQSLYANRSCVYATKVSDNRLVQFSSGRAFQVVYGNNYQNAIDIFSTRSEAQNNLSLPSGIAVSRKYLFVSHEGLNNISVLEKTTGALIRTLPFKRPRIITSDGSNLWVNYDSTNLQKFLIRSDGTLGSALVTLTGISDPADMKVSGSTLALVDAGTKQQIRFFDNATGKEGTPFGQLGGYKTAATVANDRFGFWVMDGSGHKTARGSIAYAADGSFWIADPGNSRLQHYAPDRTFLEKIAYLGANYTLTVDPNNHSRIINGLQEFQVNYTSSIKQCWAAKYNWSGTWVEGKGTGDGLKYMVTLSNGRTFAIASQVELVELTPAGVRFTGLTFPIGCKIYPNGDIYSLQDRGLRHSQIWTKFQLLDPNTMNPTYANGITIAENFNTTANDPRLAGAKIYPYELTSNGRIVTFKGVRTDGETFSYHLGVFNQATGSYDWKASLATFVDYSGKFPENGDFDIGNGSWYQGNAAMSIEKSIFWNFTGEAWKGGQTNKWNHFSDDGLFIGQFGITSVDYLGVAPAMMAGNAYGTVVVKEGSDYYIYHNDESHHGGFHRWKVTGLNTVEEQIIPITNSFIRTSEIIPNGIDLMNIGYKTILKSSNGWTRTPETEAEEWSAKTTVFTYNKRKPTDLFITCKKTGVFKYTVDKTLGKNLALASWTLKGEIAFSNYDANSGSGLQHFFQVLDNAGKVIVRIEQTIDYNHNFTMALKANGVAIFSGTVAEVKHVLQLPEQLTISKTGSQVSVSYKDKGSITVPVFEAGANTSKPATMRQLFTGDGVGSSFAKCIDISAMVFNSKPMSPTR